MLVAAAGYCQGISTIGVVCGKGSQSRLGSTRFDVEKLTDKIDFGLWKMKVRALLIQQGLGSALLKEEAIEKGKEKGEDLTQIREGS